MKEFTYNIEANLRILSSELESSGFTIEKLVYSSDKNELILGVSDSDPDPSSIVYSHVFKEDLQPSWQDEWAKAKTTAQMLTVIAKRLGLIDITDSEYETGTLEL